MASTILIFCGIAIKPLFFPNLRPQLTLVQPSSQRLETIIDYELDFFMRKLDFLSLTYHYTDTLVDGNQTIARKEYVEQKSVNQPERPLKESGGNPYWIIMVMFLILALYLHFIIWLYRHVFE